MRSFPARIVFLGSFLTLALYILISCDMASNSQDGRTGSLLKIRTNRSRIKAKYATRVSPKVFLSCVFVPV